MIDKTNKGIRLIDLGGVTTIGVSLKESTPFYDRSKWNMGLRKSDTEYDLFSLAMLIVSLVLKKGDRLFKMDIYEIIHGLKKKEINTELVDIISKALLQKNIDFLSFMNKLKFIYKNKRIKTNIKYKNKIDKAINYYFAFSTISFFSIVIIILLNT